MSGPVEGNFGSFLQQILPPPQQDDMRFHIGALEQAQDVAVPGKPAPMPVSYATPNRDTQGAASAP